VNRLLFGGTLLFVFGLLFLLRGEVAIAVPGLVIGLGSLAFVMLERNSSNSR
jgi:hypothetical protein